MQRQSVCLTLLSVAFFCLAAFGQDMPALPAPDFSSLEAVPVLRIIDGDTLVLLLEGEETTVRLIGVDTPETVHPQKPVEAHGKEASRFLRNLLKGESVYVVYEHGQRETDTYGRTLAYLCRAPDGLFVNLEIIRQGYGHAYTAFPFEHMELFRFYERRARETEKGLWAPDVGEEKPSAEPVSGAYRLFQKGRVTNVLTFNADHTLATERKAIGQHRWEVTDEGLVVMFYSGRWLFKPTGKGGFTGEYTGPDTARIGQKAYLLPGGRKAAPKPVETAATTTAEPLPIAPPAQTFRQAPPVQAPPPQTVTVYVTRTGKKYHRGDCRYLSKSKIPITLQDAKRRGYTPCKVCRPPG